ncbi:MAG: hypothetical protein NTV88_03330 [Candidatus Micrarchaeota archaeon]|nr:hypothetical protein [Candidatus Micrarchaeota archaeon]
MKTMLLTIFAVGLLLFGCAGAAPQAAKQQSANGQQPPAGSNQQPAASAPSSPATGAGTAVKFADEPYASNAVEIYPGTTSGASSGEIPSFTMSQTQQADGTVKITMTEKTSGQVLQATVPKGGKLYFNDANLGDDAGGQDKYLQDDKLIAVDSNGYVVTQ